MRIFLVRHGQSQSNVDPGINVAVADHAIQLTEEGHVQAEEAGKFLASYFETYLRILPTRVRLWHSPYTRTRQTAAQISRTCVMSESFADWWGPLGRRLKVGRSFFMDPRGEGSAAAPTKVSNPLILP